MSRPLGKEAEHNQRGQAVRSPYSFHTYDPLLTQLLFRLAEHIENEPARLKAEKEAKRAKLEALEKRLGINPASAASSSSAAAAEEAGPSRPATKPGTPEPLAGKKHRFDDTEYIEQSREIVDNVKSAVAAGMFSPPAIPFE